MADAPRPKFSLSGSNAARWLKCYGSVWLAAQLPPQVENKYMREGTLAHALAETALRSGLDAAAYVGERLKDWRPGEAPVSAEMAKHVQVYLDFVRERFGASGAPGQKLHIEQSFTLDFLGPNPDGKLPRGINDASFLAADMWLEIFDYKHGAGKGVEAEDNSQLYFYGLGAIEWAKKLGISIMGVRAHIIQPRFTGGAPIKSTEMERDELLEMRFEMKKAATEARKPDAARTPGPWCKATWCQGATLLRCAEFCNGAKAAAMKEGAGEEIADPMAMSPEELGRRYQAAALLKDYLKCLEEHVLAEAKAGRMPKGLKWVKGRGSRHWKDSEIETTRALAKLSNMPFTETKLLSVAQAEKVAGALAKQESFRALWTAKEGGPVLAPITDKRPEYQFAEREAFEDISGPLDE